MTFDHNLGANQAAYAIVFPELNALLASLSGDLTQYTMHVDVRMGCDPTLFGTMKMPWSVMAKL